MRTSSGARHRRTYLPTNPDCTSSDWLCIPSVIEVTLLQLESKSPSGIGFALAALSQSSSQSQDVHEGCVHTKMGEYIATVGHMLSIRPRAVSNSRNRNSPTPSNASHWHNYELTTRGGRDRLQPRLDEQRPNVAWFSPPCNSQISTKTNLIIESW